MFGTESQPIAVPSAHTPGAPQFPFLDLKAQHATLAAEIATSVSQVLESQQLILGPAVEAFEQEVADLLSCSFCIGCASGSDALLLAMMALNVKEGDEVITTPFTFVATAGAIARLGARPVFVDILPDTYNMDPAGLERAISSKTRAVIPVHLFGLMAAMDSIMPIAQARGIPVVEDAAQAIAARAGEQRAGCVGDVGCFSFFPSKNLGGAGDGGLLSTNDPRLADSLRVLRTHGSRTKYHYERIGINSRLDTLQAAVLRVKLRHLSVWTTARRQNATRYRELFAEAGLSNHVQVPCEPAGFEHVYNQFVIRVSNRDELRRHLTSAGIPTEIYYPLPLHLQPAFSYLGYEAGDFPVAEHASKEVLALPIFPELTYAQQQAVVAAISEFYGAHSSSQAPSLLEAA